MVGFCEDIVLCIVLMFVCRIKLCDSVDNCVDGVVLFYGIIFVVCVCFCVISYCLIVFFVGLIFGVFIIVK